MYKIVLIGSVSSTLVTLESLIKFRMDIAGVLGFEPIRTENVSGYKNMSAICSTHNIPYYSFRRINDPENVERIRNLKPDILFVVGLSQIVSIEILSIAQIGNIGFHPTLLPRGRGRAPIAWLILKEKFGAASFFLMSEGIDDGPIFIQEPFEVSKEDDASTIEYKLLNSIEIALNKWLPQLKKGEWNAVPQQEIIATYYGKRTSLDGLIQWGNTAVEIEKLIRASTKPHPGAYSFLNFHKIIIWKGHIESKMRIRGVTGRVLLVKNDNFLVQCGKGQVWINSVTNESNESVKLKVGEKLGYYIEDEIYHLKNEIETIKKWMKEKIS